MLCWLRPVAMSRNFSRDKVVCVHHYDERGVMPKLRPCGDVRGIMPGAPAMPDALKRHSRTPTMRLDADDLAFDAHKENLRVSKKKADDKALQRGSRPAREEQTVQKRSRPASKGQSVTREPRRQRRGQGDARTRSRSNSIVPRSRPDVASPRRQLKHPRRHSSRRFSQVAGVNQIPLGHRVPPFNVFGSTAKPPEATMIPPKVCVYIGPSLILV